MDNHNSNVVTVTYVDPITSQVRQSFMCFDSQVDVASGTTALVSTISQQAFKPTKFYVQSGVAAASMFSPENNVLKFNTVPPGQNIAISVTNRSAYAGRFMATMFGNVLQTGPQFEMPKSTQEKQDKKTKPMCGCGQHEIDFGTDPYEAHNVWELNMFKDLQTVAVKNHTRPGDLKVLVDIQDPDEVGKAMSSLDLKRFRG